MPPTKAHELMRDLVLAEIKNRASKPKLSLEQVAVEAALRGNLRPLVGLLPTNKIAKRH